MCIGFGGKAIIIGVARLVVNLEEGYNLCQSKKSLFNPKTCKEHA
jgi:hypothetical protein